MSEFLERAKDNNQIEAQEAGQRYNFEVFEKSEPYFEHLIEEMLPAIRNHEYSVVIGDDVSGRIPTLVLRKFINEAYRRDGAEPPETIFYAGGQRDAKKKIEEAHDKISQDFSGFLKKRKKQNKREKKALIVTEYICGGRGINNLVGAVRKFGIECDVATLSSSKGAEYSYTSELSNLKGVNVYSGKYDAEEFLFYRDFKKSGVDKKIGKTDIHSFTVNEQPSDDVIKAREDVNLLAQRLIDKYLGPKNEK